MKTTSVTIRWKHNNNEEDVVVALQPYTEVIPDSVDEDIFYYFEDKEELEDAIGDEDFDAEFVILECHSVI